MSIADTCDQLELVSSAWLTQRDAMHAPERYAVEGWLRTLVKLGQAELTLLNRESLGSLSNADDELQERFLALKRRVEGL